MQLDWGIVVPRLGSWISTDRLRDRFEGVLFDLVADANGLGSLNMLAMPNASNLLVIAVNVERCQSAFKIGSDATSMAVFCFIFAPCGYNEPEILPS